MDLCFVGDLHEEEFLHGIYVHVEHVAVRVGGVGPEARRKRAE